MTNRNIPVLVGVGEAKNASRRCEDAVEPLDLMLQAIQAAAQDATPSTNTEFLRDIDTLHVVASSTWIYNDLPGLLSQRLGIKPVRKAYSRRAGNSSVEMIDDAAQLIGSGESEIALIVGGEAFASLKEFIKMDSYPPPWTARDPNARGVHYANDLNKLDGISKVHQIGVPMQVYPLYENAFRSHRGQTIESNHEESTKLYANFATIAEKNPMAWNFGKQTETETSIGTIGGGNRMICSPYPLLMNAFNDVNLSSACIVVSTQYAERMGIPKEKWIYPLGAGRASDSDEFWNRPNFHSSPAIAKALDMALETSGLTTDDMDMFDFYSCFPIVPKLACSHLGIPLLSPTKPITLLGGLTSFGGAGCNYSMHAVAEMVRRLRITGRERKANGLILANGGVLTHENAICLSTEISPDKQYPQHRELANMAQSTSPPVSPTAYGEVVIETYTVEYDRQNRPMRGHVVCRLKGSNNRVIANHADSETLLQLASWKEEPIGRSGYVFPSISVPGRNLFSFSRERKL